MRRSGRFAFTLVELLVVIIIIAMLAGLLLPAVVRGREAGRQAQCTSNQHQIALAVQQFENARGYLPGFIDSFGGVNELSWITMLLPYLGEEELWKKWRDPNVTLPTKYQNARPDLPVVKCPSDTGLGPTELSYVANCGRADLNPNDPNYPRLARGSGLFFDRTGNSPVKIRTEMIPDGAANTILFTENLQATYWAPPLDSNGAWYPPKPAHVGVGWVLDYVGGSLASPCWPINKCREEPQNPMSPAIYLARPSSDHPGGVVMTYADGRQQFFNEEMDYGVFQKIMAPDDANAGIP